MAYPSNAEFVETGTTEPRAEQTALSETARALDWRLQATVARAMGGLSPVALTSTWANWAMNLAASPGRQIELGQRALQDLADLVAGKIDPPDHDHRFADPAWQAEPFRSWAAAFGRAEDWWTQATRGLPALSSHDARMTAFFARQALDTVSPSNFPLTNPEVVERTRAAQGLNLWRGAGFWLEDMLAGLSGATDDTGEFTVGQDLAATPGEVVYRNRLIELIRYAPTTRQVREIPLLIVPAWIMKYYILDLQAQHSLIRWLVDQGFTVFCISWKNPEKEDRNLSFDDYRELGVMAAVDAVTTITGAPRMHAMGYCLGGTLLSVAAAAMARDGDQRLATLTLLAAQVDFTEAGALSLFTTSAQVALLEALMWDEGYLDESHMAGTFSLLKSKDLIWSHMVHEYLLGEREAVGDLAAWSHDATRMPARMHSEYLRHMYLENDLAEGRMTAGGRPVALEDISAPVFAVATERDHIAPWHSVFKLTRLLPGDLDFALVAGGHNSGIVSPPGAPRAAYRLLKHRRGETHPPADEWASTSAPVEGSWWPAWAGWLEPRSGAQVAPPPMTTQKYPGLGPAPGSYVLQR